MRADEGPRSKCLWFGVNTKVAQRLNASEQPNDVCLTAYTRRVSADGPGRRGVNFAIDCVAQP